MQRRALAVWPDVEDCRRSRDAFQALHRRNVGPELLQGGEDKIGLLVIADPPDGEALKAELGGVDHRSPRCARDGQADFVDECDIAALRDGDDRPPENVEDVKADDRDVVAHEFPPSTFRTTASPKKATRARAMAAGIRARRRAGIEIVALRDIWQLSDTDQDRRIKALATLHSFIADRKRN